MALEASANTQAGAFRVAVDLRVEPDGEVRALSLPELSTPTETELTQLPDTELVWVVDSAGIGWPMTR